MTRETMLTALEQIEKTPKGHVHAARRGVVAAVHGAGNHYVAFRNRAGRITAERWPSSKPLSEITAQAVPPDLQPRVRSMLDNL